MSNTAMENLGAAMSRVMDEHHADSRKMSESAEMMISVAGIFLAKVAVSNGASESQLDQSLKEAQDILQKASNETYRKMKAALKEAGLDQSDESET